MRSMIPLQFTQARRYGAAGIGLGGALLKHSLYPLTYLARLLPASGTVADLGCGEGMLTNLLAHSLPGVRFIGIDREPGRIAKARVVAAPNASFHVGDIADCPIREAAAVILNDVLHHHPYEHQSRLLVAAFEVLDNEGVIIIKEVDVRDRADVRWTRFWDGRLYPGDPLNFRTSSDWQQTLRRSGFRVLETYRSRHPWPASRTIIVATKRPKLAGALSSAVPSGVPIAEAPALQRVADPARVLVTGATGFMGEHLVRELLRCGIDGRPARVLLLARDPSMLPPDIRTSAAVEVLEADLLDITQVAVAVAGCEFVFHLAARVDFFAGEQVLEENLAPVRNLLAACSKTHLRRFTYTSTIGAVDRAPGDRCATALDEQSVPHPVSFYGRSKLEGERLIAASGLPFTIVRIPWCYGPGMSPTHHVRALLEKVATGSLVFRFAWPGRVSLIEVGTAMRTLCAVASDARTLNELYFLTDGEPISFATLFAMMGRVSGRRAGYLRVPRPIVMLASTARRWLPFQLKCLLMDAMAASNAKLAAAGHAPAPRRPDFLLPLFRYVSQQRMPSRHRTRTLITGAAGGIGLALAQRFYSLGYSLLLVDKNERALCEIASALGAGYRAVDLADETSCRRFADDLETGREDLEIVINNAGIGARGEYASLSHERHLDMIKVNCTAPVLINRAVLPNMLRKGTGTIINIASSAAFQPLPYMAVYSASKAFILSYSQAIAGELRWTSRRNVVVMAIVPSGTNTSFQRTAGVRETDGLLDADYVAARIVDSIGRGKHTVMVGVAGRLMSLSARVISGNARPFVWAYLMRRMR